MNENERIGFIGELLTQYRLAEFGVKSFMTNQPNHDIVAETSAGLKTIQVKTRSCVSDDKGNVTFKVSREHERHKGRGSYVAYNCDIFAFVYLPLEVVIFVANQGQMSGGFNIHHFTKDMSVFSAETCGLLNRGLHARGARDTIKRQPQSTFNFFED
jgi:hypothetical protein